MNVVRREQTVNRRHTPPRNEDLTDDFDIGMPSSEPAANDNEGGLSQKEFEDLYTANVLSIERYVRRVVPGISEEKAADAVADAFVKLMARNTDNTLRLDNENSARAWVRTAAVNRARDIERRDRKLMLHDEASSGDFTPDQWMDRNQQRSGRDAYHMSPERILLDLEKNGDILDLIHEALDTAGLVSEDQKQVLLLRFFQNKKHEEVARALGIPLGTSLSREYNALKKIRRYFGVEDVKLQPNKGPRKKKSEQPVVETVVPLFDGDIIEAHAAK